MLINTRYVQYTMKKVPICPRLKYGEYVKNALCNSSVCLSLWHSEIVLLIDFILFSPPQIHSTQKIHPKYPYFFLECKNH